MEGSGEETKAGETCNPLDYFIVSCVNPRDLFIRPGVN